MKHLIHILLSGLLAFAITVNARDSHQLDTKGFAEKYSAVQVVKGVTIPWAMVQLPNGDILVSERSGELRIIRQGKLLDKKVNGLPSIDDNGQGGLLDLALHPDFDNNRWLYITYASDAGAGRGSNTALMRAKYNSQTLSLSNQTVLYKGEENSTKGQHYGSRIAFDDKGFVYFSIGDRGKRESNPQNLSKDGGKIYRLHDDGKIPKDNPFVEQLGAKPAIFSYGHRNPQGLAFNPVTRELWSHEHGPRGGDEVNLISKGLNYGWPVISYGINYSGTKFTDITEKTGMQQPALYWVPSIAPSAMIYVTSDKYPDLKGKFILGSMKFGYLVVLEIKNGVVVKQSQLLKGIGRVRSLMQGKDGFLYAGIDGDSIKKITLN